MSLKNKASAGLVWTFSQQFGNQIIGFVISLVLARILMPEEFGLIGMIGVFVSVGRSLIDSGLTQSLIRSKEINQIDLSTVFYFNLGASVLLYLLIFLIAPFIADFYETDILIDIIRLFCLTFIIDAFATVQRTRMTKAMNFKTQTMITIPSTILGGIVGVSMAYAGYGVWSLVWSSIIVSIGTAIQFWLYSKWVPSLIFSWAKFNYHFRFGYKLTLSGILDKIFSNIYLIVIGKVFSPAHVGFYTRAETMKQLPVKNISAALNTVTYPLFAEIQHDDMRLKRVYKQLMQMVIFIIAPVLIFIAILAEPTFILLFTEKWLPAVPYFQILCITGILSPIHIYNLNVLKVKGRSDLFLKLEVIKKVLIVLTILVSINFGILGLLYGQVFTSILFFLINSFYTGRFIHYSTLEQVQDIMPILLIALTMGGVVFLLDRNYLETMGNILRIFTSGTVALLLYFFISFLAMPDLFRNIRNLLAKK